MQQTKPISLTLGREMGVLARERLTQSLDAVSHATAGQPDPPDYGQLTTLPLAEISPKLSRAAYRALTTDPLARRDERWGDIRRRAAGLRRELRNTELPATTFGRQRRLVNLAFFTAGVMVPLLAEHSAYHRAAKLAGAIYKLVISDSHRRVLGAGAEGADPRMRYLMLAPVLWSLAAFHPAAQPEWSVQR